MTTNLLLGALASTWAAIEGYDMMRSNPETTFMNLMGNLMFLVAIVLLAVDVCQLLQLHGVM